MNTSTKQILLGISLGCAPLVVCAALYYITPLVVSGNAGSLLSFAVFALFILSSIGAFVIALIMIARNKPVVGRIALALQIAQLVGLVYLLS